ncbi:hypothetical protein WDW89_15995 [Deltaproteobacteria bacterium TL4]
MNPEHQFDGSYSLIYKREGESDAQGYQLPIVIKESQTSIRFYNRDKEIVEIKGSIDKTGKLTLNSSLGGIWVNTEGHIDVQGNVNGTYVFERNGETFKGLFKGHKTGNASQAAPVNAIGLAGFLQAILGR